MARATFLIIENENPEGLSSRKLVVETAKHNVLTAYSGKEGLEIFGRFPVDAVVIHSGIRDLPCGQVVAEIKKKKPKLPVVVISPNVGHHCDSADREIGSHDPQVLLEVLQEIIAA